MEYNYLLKNLLIAIERKIYRKKKIYEEKCEIGKHYVWLRLRLPKKGRILFRLLS